MTIDRINWGIIGCGDVTEIKSGPAFNLVPNSFLAAVMRRNPEKAADYAFRHKVPVWYSDGDALINDPDVNAVYIATPPDSHEYYSKRCMDAGKPVYIEKPVTTNAAAAQRITDYAIKKNIKVSIAHYRRQQPVFKRIREILQSGLLGSIRLVDMKYMALPLTPEELQNERIAWRLDPVISGGGLFQDLAPHQLDIMSYFFGAVEKAVGMGLNQAKQYAVDDLVTGFIQYKNGTVFTGSWCFAANEPLDTCTIYGEKGSLRFTVFNKPFIEITIDGNKEMIPFEPLKHVQQPMIEAVVNYFLDRGPNPCPSEAGVESMWQMEQFSPAPKALLVEKV
jgi:predicted dehydrogenase